MKAVRVEDADITSPGIRVSTYERSLNGNPDRLVMRRLLDGPGSSVEFVVHYRWYLVVEEVTHAGEEPLPIRPAPAA